MHQFVKGRGVKLFRRRKTLFGWQLDVVFVAADWSAIKCSVSRESNIGSSCFDRLLRWFKIDEVVFDNNCIDNAEVIEIRSFNLVQVKESDIASENRTILFLLRRCLDLFQSFR